MHGTEREPRKQSRRGTCLVNECFTYHKHELGHFWGQVTHEHGILLTSTRSTVWIKEGREKEGRKANMG